MRYPRLIILLRHQVSLTLTEAIGCIEGRESEAVIHYGGREKALRDAFKARSRLYKQFNSSPFEYWFFRRDRNTLREVGL